MLLGEKFKLEVHWKKVSYEKGIANIQGCYLSGPVLKEVEQLNEEDFIKLDFSNQYIIFVKNYYIAKLFWSGVKHTTEKIFLYNAKFENININVVPKLRNSDYIVIDTKNHEDEKHQYNMLYSAYLVKKDGMLYNFSGSR